MNGVKARRGSAVLIVIGMLAFMVISAVSFAIYMRQSRMPSSYLRRSSTSRYLLKAALANAINRIDGTLAANGYADLDTDTTTVDQRNRGKYSAEGICDDAYPGRSTESDTQKNGNYWPNRIFTPFGSISPELTVSTLTLEGLAYLPPAIINEARVYSRTTRTAKWANLAYDAGRYAFCAIDVSDCFDINKVRANERRSSASNRRVNLSPLFENNASAVDTVLKKGSDTGVPFVSLADYNILNGDTAFTPFCKYIGKTGSQIYSMGDWQTISNSLFITDTWFPAGRSEDGTVPKRYDLEGGSVPFKTMSENDTVMTPQKNQTQFCKALQKNIGFIGLACLHDYLDADSEPLSLCIPTVETTPMICGVGFDHNSQFKLGVDSSEVLTGKYDSGRKDQYEQPIMYKRTATSYKLVVQQATGLKLACLATFPFRRAQVKGYNPGSCKYKALVRVFFGPKTIPSRLDKTSPIYPGSDASSRWSAQTSDYKDGIIELGVGQSVGSFSCKDDAKTEDAVYQIAFPLVLKEIKMPLFWQVRDENENSEVIANFSSLDGVWNNNNRFMAFDVNGKLNDFLATKGKAKNSAASMPKVENNIWQGTPVKLQDGEGAISTDTFVPHVVVWVRVENEDGITVDMVPARFSDDELWARRSGTPALDDAMPQLVGAKTPVLEFRGDEDRAFDISITTGEKLKADAADTFKKWTCLYTVDPRYNFAPENWFAVATGTGVPKKDDWLAALDKILGQKIGNIQRDRDIFMFTSDQEYMQSIGELAFLPYTQVPDGSSGSGFGTTYMNSVNFEGADMVDRLTTVEGVTGIWSKFGCRDFFWRTYSALDDDLYNLEEDGAPIEVVSGSGDFRANPFSLDSRVLAAVVRDTPFDFAAASTNKDTNLMKKDERTTGATPAQARQYCFGSECPSAKWTNEEIEDLIAEMHDSFADYARQYRKNGYDWSEAFSDYLAWYDGNRGDEQKKLFGVELDNPLYGVDRKFLYAFWHECFQNRQQLFLVFIRAEPLTVGGMGSDSLGQSQLGARGVALVWRDPDPPYRGRNSRKARGALASANNWRTQNEHSGPHRTRVLFYHQFD